MAPKGNHRTAETMPLHPIKTLRASEAIVEQVKELIAKGELKPGDRLPSERAMMDLLQRSRPTIREALRMLENSGLIRISAGANGAVVQEFNTTSVEQSLESMLQFNKINLDELSEYRELTDSAIASFAAKRRTAKDIENLQAVLDDAKKCLDDYQSFVKYDSKFHGLLAKAAKNEVAHLITLVLSRVVMGFIENKMRNLSPEERRSMCSKILEMHTNILASVVAGDSAASMKAMETHVWAFNHDLENVFQ